MKYANLAIDYENEVIKFQLLFSIAIVAYIHTYIHQVKKSSIQSKRLQDYAEKIASQEVKYLQALAMALPPPQPNDGTVYVCMYTCMHVHLYTMVVTTHFLYLYVCECL